MNFPLTIPSAEPFLHVGDRVGCLIVHGFTGTPYEMRPLGDYLFEEGHTVLGVRLAGHATDPTDLSRIRWRDWLMTIEDGLNLLKGVSDQQSSSVYPWGCPHPAYRCTLSRNRNRDPLSTLQIA